MRTIDLQTTHNVLITKQLASVPERIGAFILDLIILMVLTFVVFFIGNLSSLLAGTTAFILTYTLTLGIFFLYSLVSEIIGKGMTLGKRIVGIRAVRLDGERYSISDAVSRWSMRFIDIYFTLGTMAVVTIGTSVNGQRLGDKMANTTVVKNKDSSFFSLSDIVRLKNKRSYESTYNTVTRLSDQDVLVIKRALKRFKDYETRGNRETITNLTANVSEVMGLEEAPKNQMLFLKEVIKDYIALTR